jgi:hypothetical protein
VRQEHHASFKWVQIKCVVVLCYMQL